MSYHRDKAAQYLSHYFQKAGVAPCSVVAFKGDMRVTVDHIVAAAVEEIDSRTGCDEQPDKAPEEGLARHSSMAEIKWVQGLLQDNECLRKRITALSEERNKLFRRNLELQANIAEPKDAPTYALECRFCATRWNAKTLTERCPRYTKEHDGAAPHYHHRQPETP